MPTKSKLKEITEQANAHITSQLTTAERRGAAEYPDELEACKPYLKDGESPAECIARNRADVATMLRALGVAKLRAEKAESRIAELESQLATAKRNGAVEELRRLADEWGNIRSYGYGYAAQLVRQRADDLEREGK